jgi:carbon-monoxide dehydrogenase large subunit
VASRRLRGGDTEAQALDAPSVGSTYEPAARWWSPSPPWGRRPQLHDAAPGNLAFLAQGRPRPARPWRRGARHRGEDPEPAREPPRRSSRAPALAWAEGGRLHLLCNGQAVHGIRRQLCVAMGLDEAALHVLAPDVGGGFGVKNVAFPEHAALLHAARVLARPVRWVSSIGDDLAAAGHGRGLHGNARLALDAEGRMLALDVDAVAEMGAYLSANGPHCPTNAAATAMGGCYAIPAIAFTVRGVFSNTAPVEAYRGAGKPEANFIIESLLEQGRRRQRCVPAT